SFASLRPLGVRGRVAGEEIWVGSPGWGLATTERCAWQAAHEATVLEVVEQCPEAARHHEVREVRAIQLLQSRAQQAGLGEPHARWLSTFTVPLPG
ncbi:MAG: hypothetical protein RMJ98_18710, partial [Myxococcales bacterium]|nr:hypothetical protein [Polyangiaceae bacterium]MDW8251332.1 hypothetical protein [Myxococcales bacterium]